MVLIVLLSLNQAFAQDDTPIDAEQIAEQAAEEASDSLDQQSTAPKLWKMGGGINLNFNQVSLSNWSGGGNSSIALGSLVNLYAEYEYEKHAWVNRATMAYGVLRQGGSEERVQKTDDQLILISRYTYRIVRRWSVSGNIDFRTQFDDGYNYNSDGTNTLISTFMTPAYLLANVGVSYRYKDILSLTASPLASRTTFVMHDRGGRINPVNYGLEEGKKTRFQGGFTFIGSIRKELMENMNLAANINIFTDYQDMWPVDVAGEAILNMKVNKFITASLSTQFIYDSQFTIIDEAGESIVGPLQMKNIVAVGFAYNFKNHKN